MKNKLPIILLILFGIFFYSVYKEATKSAKSKRLECQSKTTTFEKIFVEEPIKEAIKAFKTGNYEINSSIEYSKYMKSHLKDILTKEQSDELLKNIINKYLISMEQKNQVHRSDLALQKHHPKEDRSISELLGQHCR